MEKLMNTVLLLFVSFLLACSGPAKKSEATVAAATDNGAGSGQSAVKDDVSSRNIVQVASASKDHSTLVTAVKAADLVDVLSNAGPFTVFAPMNSAFEKLPAGTVEGLLKADKKDALADLLQYHVSVGVYKQESFTDGQSIGQVNGGNITIKMVDGKPLINGKAHIIASITASNGIIHVIDEVLSPAK
jgi:uncharacterized surface protein with fasciclin (FAS1) repeats